MAFLLNMFIDIENENNDPYYHDNLNNDNIDPNANLENTYENNNYENSTNIYDNNYLDIFDNNLNMTIRNFISYITNNTFMYNNSTTMSVDDYINLEEQSQNIDNHTVEIFSSSEDEPE